MVVVVHVEVVVLLISIELVLVLLVVECPYNIYMSKFILPMNPESPQSFKYLLRKPHPFDSGGRVLPKAALIGCPRRTAVQQIPECQTMCRGI